MDNLRIAELLCPFTGDTALPESLLDQLQQYLALLLRWNARINLTAVRDPEQVVTRHFGESLFAAQLLAGDLAGREENGLSTYCHNVLHPTLADIGSGAGFPGVPIKLLASHIDLTLIESQNKKATFLREVLRTLGLNGAEVFRGRAEQWGKAADIVTLRAVEKFENTLPIAIQLVAPGGKLCLLISSGQVPTAQQIAGKQWKWAGPAAIPTSLERVVLIGGRDDEPPG